MFLTRGVNTFSSEGRLFQVKYAIESIKPGSTAIGLKTKEGVVVTVEKHITSPLLVSLYLSSVVRICALDDCPETVVVNDATLPQYIDIENVGPSGIRTEGEPVKRISLEKTPRKIKKMISVFESSISQAGGINILFRLLTCICVLYRRALGFLGYKECIRNVAKEQIGSLAEFYKDTGHLTGNSMFHALMLARFADAWFWQAKIFVASSRKRQIDMRGSRAVQVGSRAVHNGLLDAGVSPHRKFRIKSVVLNAELPVNSRLHILEGFNDGLFDCLIATDDSD
ncbi:proteasome subunit alpha type-5 [Tanacetum coccineum]